MVVKSRTLYGAPADDYDLGELQLPCEQVLVRIAFNRYIRCEPPIPFDYWAESFKAVCRMITKLRSQLV